VSSFCFLLHCRWSWFTPFLHTYTLPPSTLPRLISSRTPPALLCSTMSRPSFVPPSHPSRVRLHSSFLSTDDPVFLFALAPSFPLHHPLRLSLPNSGPRRPPFFASSPCSSAHADCVSLVLVPSARSFSFARHTYHPSVHCAPTPPCSFPLLFGLYMPACTTLTPLFTGPCATSSAASSSITTSTPA
jgi:hypothetical protein